MLLCSGLCVVVAAVALASLARAQEAEAPLAEPLLPLPAKVGAGLDAAAFEGLGPNWEAWSEDAAEAIRKLYEESPDAASQIQALADVHKRLTVIDKALKDPKYKMIHTQLLDLQGKLSRRLDVYDALTKLLTAPRSTAKADTPAGVLAELKSAVNELETNLLVIPQGASWLPFIRSEDLLAIAASGTITDENRTVIEEVLKRLDDTSALADKQRAFLQQEPFRRVAKVLNRAMLLSPVEGDSDWKSRLRGSAAELLVGLEEYEATGSRGAAASARQAFESLQSLGGAASEPLTTAMRGHYFNYNLNAAASEGFLSRFVSQRRSESGRVSEYVDDVYISGCQWTNTKVGINVKPGDKVARFDLTLDGDVRTRTIGEVSSATVYNRGWACFRAEKEITFDGRTFALSGARVGARANNDTYDAETCLEWLPLARSIARSIALSKAADKKPQADAYTRTKISQEVRGRFDRESSQQFADAQRDLHANLIDPLADIRLYPELLRLSSTEQDAIVRGRLMQDRELGGGRPPKAASPTNGLLLQIHQSLLSNGADRMDFAGRKMTQTEVNDRIEAKLKTVFKKKEFKRDKPLREDGTLLVFDEVDPISFQLEDQTVSMVLRAGLERPGEEDIPTQIITVPMKLSLEGGKIVMNRGPVGVKPARRPPSIGAQIARAQIMRSKIQEGIPEQKTRDATMKLDQNGKVVTVQVRDLKVEDGWMTILAE